MCQIFVPAARLRARGGSYKILWQGILYIVVIFCRQTMPHSIKKIL